MERNPFASQSFEHRFRKLPASGNFHKAKVISKSFLHDKKVTDAKKYAMIAETVYYRGEYQTCKKSIVKAIGSGGQNISWINLLGKCLMQLQDFARAAKCFLKAHKVPSLILNVYAIWQ